MNRQVSVAGDERTVMIAQSYDATIEEVWDACTDAERIARWFLPVTGELRLGGRYQLEGNAGGTIERCDPPRSFAATWEFGEQVSSIELRLAPEPSGGTRLELDHTVPADGHWDQYGPGAVGVGWELGLRGLGLHLATGATADPAAAQAWMASEEGRRFMSLSSAGWGEAAIAAGEPPDWAREAAERTAKVYTGAPV
jgi:uncharacterized protein YndB with AHSA1/START domain